MSTPHKCPVCEGSGQVEDLPPHGSTSTGLGTRACHACDGKGVVWSPDEPLGNVPVSHKPVWPEPYTFPPPVPWPAPYIPWWVPPVICGPNT